MDNLIFDRTQADVTYATELNRKLNSGEALTSQELADWNAGLKGAYNATDMNRVDAAVREIGAKLTAAGYPVRYTSPVPKPEKPLKNFTLKSDGFQQAPYLYATGEHDTQYADDYISTKVMIDVSASQKIYITTNVALLQDSGFVWYDKNRQFISGAKSEDISKYSMSATPPQNARYCNININSTGITPNNIQNVNVIYNGADDYIELTYIQSSGTQYIDTGYKPNSNTRVVCKIFGMDTSHGSEAVFGARTSTSATDKFVFLVTDNKNYRTDYGNNNAQFSTSINFSGDFVIDKNKNVTILNESNQLSNTAFSFNSSLNLFLFASNTGGTANIFSNGMGLKYCKIYDNNILVRDFIPAIQNGRIGLYDKVESKMYYNSGTADFIAGEAFEFAELTYIEATGTQYIDTGYKPNNNTKIHMVVKTTNKTSSAFPAFWGTRDNGAVLNAFGLFLQKGTSTLYYQYGTQNQIVSSSALTTGDTIELIMSDSLYINNSMISQVNQESFQSQQNLFLCATNDGKAYEQSSIIIYSVQIYDNNTIVRDYIPAIQHGKIGLYDKIEGKMYVNSGTDDFYAGDIVAIPSEPNSEPEITEFELGDIISYETWYLYLSNVQAIRDAYYTMADTPSLPKPTAPLNFNGANAVEKLIYDVHVLYNAMSASYRKCGTFQAGVNVKRLPLQRGVT